MAVEDLLRAKREENLRVCAKYGAYNVRVFGSVARAKPTNRAISISSLSLSLAGPFLTWEVSNTIWSSSWGAGWTWSRNMASSLVSESVCFERRCRYERPQGTAAGQLGSDRRSLTDTARATDYAKHF
jgi:hypothetical protein